MNDNTLLRPVIGVGVVIWRGKQILLGERITATRSNCWQFPGGHLESNESVIECARREVLEETGLHIKKLRHLGFTDKLFDMAQRKYITLLVSCEYDSGEVQTLEPDKCAGWQWFDYQELPAPLFVPITSFLSQITEAPLPVIADDLYELHCASQVLSEPPAGAHR